MKRVDRTLRLQRKRIVEACAPSTILRSRCSLRMIPLPRLRVACAGEDEDRDALPEIRRHRVAGFW